MRQNTDPLNIKKCLKFADCQKIDMVLDHDLLEEQYLQVIDSVCGKCGEYEVNNQSAPAFP